MGKFYSKILLVLIMFCSYTGYSQVSVTATAGTTGPTTYTTLKAAFDAINAGTHQGAITIDITASTTETATAELKASATPASYTSVTIKPTATATISGSIAGPLVDLNGASNVTIDGRIGATGTTRSLTLTNLSTSSDAGTSTTRFINGAQNATLTYLNINGSSLLGADASATVLIDSSTAANGNSNIIISFNDIGAAGTNLPSLAIYSIGESATLANSSVTVTGNLIHDYFAVSGLSGGIIVDANSTGWTITHNHLYQTGTRTSTGSILHAGIYVAAGSGHNITSNFIGGNAASAGGTATTINGAFSNRFFGIRVDVGTTATTAVDGNTIANINITSTPAASSNVFTGIQLDGGNVNVGNNTGNTIGSQTGNGSVTLTVEGASVNFNDGIISFSTDTVSIQNNTVGAITANGAATGTVVLRGIEAYSYDTVTIKGNTVGGSSSGSIQANSPNNQMGGIFIYPNAVNANAFIDNNTIRNITNNSSGTNSGIINGILAQLNANSITVVQTITNNNISNLSASATSATTGSVVGINISAGSTTGSAADGNYSHNTISNLSSGSTAASFLVRGIGNTAGYPNFIKIDSNTIHNIVTAAPNTVSNSNGVAQGIAITTASSGNVSISGNVIHNIEATASAATHAMGVGLFYGSNTNSATLSRNKIYDIKNTSASGMASGMVLRGSSGTGTFNVINNFISLMPADAQAYGIQNNATATQLNAYFNSIYIGGTASGSNNSAAFARNGATVNTGVDLKNNIFYNVRTGGSGNHYAILNNNSTPATGWGSSNYNNIYSSTAANAVLWGSTSQTLAAYSTASGQDANSKSVTVSFVNPANGDLHLSGSSLTDVNLKGTTITGITTDIDGDTRHTTAPFMGADEGSITTSVTRIDANIHNMILMPNIVKNNSVLRVNAQKAMKVDWNITDISGRTVLMFSKQVNAGQTDIQLSLEKLPAGSYQLNGYTDKGRTVVIRFIKM